MWLDADDAEALWVMIHEYDPHVLMWNLYHEWNDLIGEELLRYVQAEGGEVLFTRHNEVGVTAYKIYATISEEALLSETPPEELEDAQ